MLFMKDRSSNLKLVVPNLEASTTHILSFFYNPWILPYSVFAYLLAYNSTQSVSKLFDRHLLKLSGVEVIHKHSILLAEGVRLVVITGH